MRAVAALLAMLTLLACGNRSPRAATRDDAGVAPRDGAIVVDVPARPLGLPELESFGWRQRGGHPAFRVARTAEAHADWPTVITTCQQALAADPGHLEAAWLLAAALGRAGRLDEILAPLQLAVAGDFGKWGAASLDHPALQAFLATPTGQAWRRHVELDRAAYLAALARSVIVSARGDLFAFDPEAARWHRLTRTYGAVVAQLRVPAANRLVYLTRHRDAVGIGIVDLARGRTSRPVQLAELATIPALSIAYATKGNSGVWVGAPPRGKLRPTVWRRLDETGALAALPAKAKRPPGPWLELTGRTPRLHARPASVTADWDDGGLASAIRIGRSNRVIAVPGPLLIDGSSATWSPDRARLAFTAQLPADEECTPDAVASAAYVADAATGRLAELERAANGLAVEWVADRMVAVAGDRGVSLVDLDGAPPTPLPGADGLVAPRQRPTCAPPAPEPEPLPEPDHDPDTSDPAVVGPVESADAGVVDARGPGEPLTVRP